MFKLKVRSAFVSFVYMIFWIPLGASGSLVNDQYLKFKWLTPSNRDFLSMVNCGTIVTANKFKEMIPNEPFLKNSSPSSASSNSSLVSSGDDSKIDLNSPTPLLE